MDGNQGTEENGGEVMSINSEIINALSSLSLPVCPDVYNGTADEYITFNYFSQGDDFADDAPQHEMYFAQIHYICPISKNSLSIRDQIKKALFAVGFTWPTVTNAMSTAYTREVDEQHWVFECEYAMGV